MEDKGNDEPRAVVGNVAKNFSKHSYEVAMGYRKQAEARRQKRVASGELPPSTGKGGGAGNGGEGGGGNRRRGGGGASDSMMVARFKKRQRHGGGSASAVNFHR